MPDSIEEIILAKFDRQDAKFDELTSAISELAQAIARKEAHDHHIEQNLVSLSKRVESVEEKVTKLQIIGGGAAARSEIIGWIVKPALAVMGAGIAVAIAVATLTGGR